MRIVGLDLSLANTGVAEIVTGDERPACRVHRVATKGRKDATLAQRGERLGWIADRALDIVQGAADGGGELPALVVVEGPSYGQSRQTGEHDRSGLWWLVARGLHAAGLLVVEVPPATLKKYATGKGNATKDAVLLAVARRFPHVEVDGNDTADALVLAAMGARALGHPIDDMPKVHLEAMAKVRWPHTERDPAS